jgi:hypothetical protein
MKKIFCIILSVTILFGALNTIAQSNNVGIGTITPNHSAVLEIQSNNKGLLIPRLTNLEIRNIFNPAKGLMVFQTDQREGFYYFDGKKWQSMGFANSIAADPNDWTYAGNAIPAGAFIGTTNGRAIEFKVNRLRSGYIGTGSSMSLGYQAGAGGSFNLAVGSEALKVNTGSSNTAFGYQALFSNINTNLNLAVGPRALQNLRTNGGQNIALGANALQSMNEGYGNIAIGASALGFSTVSQGNIAIGINSLRNNNGGSNVAIGYESGKDETGSNKLYISNSNTLNPLIKGDFADKNLRINVGANNGTDNSATTTGYLAIGNFDAASPMAIPSGYRLVVESGILTERIKVALKNAAVGGDWADYVFEPDYKTKMMSLEELEKYTIENKHLPNVPSSEEMVAEGLDVAKTSRMFMEKIEELTLYMIDMNKEIKALKEKNEKLKK